MEFHTHPDMKPSQLKAAKLLWDKIQNDITAHERENYGAMITNWEIHQTSYGTFWVAAESELTGLSHNNYLRFVSHTYWHVEIMRRGALVAMTAPKSYEQFRGQRVFGIVFNKTCSFI